MPENKTFKRKLKVKKGDKTDVKLNLNRIEYNQSTTGTKRTIGLQESSSFCHMSLFKRSQLMSTSRL